MAELVTLAHKYQDADIDPTGWWCSEKLDGVRGLWTGKKFLSRAGNTFTPPAWYTEGLPNVVLDGELWLGRGCFDEGSGIVRRDNWGADAQRMGFVCFDAPKARGGFEARQEALQAAVATAACPWLMALPQKRITSEAHLDRELARIEKLGGEGLMLRKPGSLYEKRRSWSCLKVKSYQDAEAVVTEHYQGKKGKPGVLCDWNGVQIKVANGFKLDASDRPPVGTTITFGFFEATAKGKPRFPFFLRVA